MTQPRISTGQSSYQYASPSAGQDHFTCSHCDRNLSGSRYIMKDDRPYCINCYEERFANTCEECRRKIGTDSKVKSSLLRLDPLRCRSFQDLSYKDRHWHERCFFCSMCKTPLVDKPFGCKNEQLFCGECYNQQFASRCDKCNQIFKPGPRPVSSSPRRFDSLVLPFRNEEIGISRTTVSRALFHVFVVHATDRNEKLYSERAEKLLRAVLRRTFRHEMYALSEGDRTRRCDVPESTLVSERGVRVEENFHRFV